MKIIKSTVMEEDKKYASTILTQLRIGDRVFGNPARGLKITLKKLEEEKKSLELNKGKLEVLDNTGDINSDIRKLKAGIKGEEDLAKYFEKVVKYDKDLQDIIVFASLSDPEHNEDSEEKGYIPDSDFIVIYGRDVLVVDAKNIVTSPEIPVYMQGNNLMSLSSPEPILELHPSIYLWKEIFNKYGVEFNSIHGLTVVVNKSGMLIWKNDVWKSSEVKPIHISELVEFLHNWISDKESITDLNMLVTISKMQIRKEKSKFNKDYISSVLKV